MSGDPTWTRIQILWQNSEQASWRASAKVMLQYCWLNDVIQDEDGADMQSAVESLQSCKWGPGGKWPSVSRCVYILLQMIPDPVHRMA